MNIERLNINIGGITSPGFSGESALFTELENLVGCKIPSEYVDFLTNVDGGHPEVGCFTALNEENKDNLFEIDVFYSIDNPSVDSLKDVFASWEETLGSKSLPIGSDGGGNQIYLKFESEEHSVWLYLHDENGVRLKLANGFTDFLDSLISNPDFI